ncbi:undecaprenyl-diphosphate phosphatase [Chroococcidiopsis sp. CCMEE 29]|uniref:undecaprenyl-diphosphate phosphatase n=1 Tax=Chroococcidiopsis sp. CCMEE 29 TaxID=155894 RepID=UPI00201FB7E1|nr:undecaprenyl-diphosphate phosphatase [Chroococcidiopsis sp. CCMEE 29]
MASLQRQLFRLLSAGLAAFSVAAFPTIVFGTQTNPTEAMPQLHQINLFQAAVLGMVQGLTEFIPISSTAHLKVVPVALGWGDPGVTFTAVIQLGSIAAVLGYFRTELMQIANGSIKAIARSDYGSNDFRMAVGIILGTLPIIFFGILIKLFIPDFDNSPLRSMAAIASASIWMSLLLGAAERIGKRKRNFDTLVMMDGIWMGLAQAMALIPGVSRSGSTITAGLLVGLERETAARFSFLLGIPAIALAGLVELKDALEQGAGSTGMAAIMVGLVSAAIFSYASIAWLLRYLQTQDTWLFVWYRLAFGVAILGAIFSGLLQNS